MQPDELKQFETWGKTPPSHEPHGSTEDIIRNLTPAKPRVWRQEGNIIKTDTALGELGHFISTDQMLTGTDANGNPILVKIKVQ